ncbi:hypothetical protein G6F56_014306 [Rhizopus delemar]|nr:hypothetical protein G6F56_014306 [Rhizopus delemar]
MLDLAQTHSQILGYRWAPPKCAVLNAPSPGSSRFVPMSLYGDALSPVDTFTYLGVPFDGQGISASSLIAHHRVLPFCYRRGFMPPLCVRSLNMA